VSAQQFTDDLVHSPLPDETQAFQLRYREVDILLIDDVHVLEKSDRA
jgi:chromosomal replication initiator protein